MRNEVKYLMSQKQLNRYKVISDSLENKITVPEVAKALGLSERQITRLRNGVKNEGAAFLIHKNSNKPSKHAISEDLSQKIVTLYRLPNYNGANFTHYKELLSEHEKINVSYAVIHQTLTKAGIASPKKRRRYKPHRRRNRKAQEGLLIQMDATPFEWFGTNDKFALHGAIDDATGKIAGLYLTKNECLHGYFETVKQMIDAYGVPISIYADRHAIFQSTKKDKLTLEEQLVGKIVNDTQFGRAMKELGITLIAARSPQAKGRIERLWDTLQSRLPIEFRIHNIITVDEANRFLQSYIGKFDEQFAVLPENTECAYVPTTLDLNLILCVKSQRSIDNGGVFSFQNKLYMVTDNAIPPKAKIDVVLSACKGIFILYKGKSYDVLPYIKPKKIVQPKDKKQPVSPSNSHYYKYGKPAMPFYSSDCTDKEILKLLEDVFLSKYA